MGCVEGVRGRGAWKGCVKGVRGRGAWKGCVADWMLAGLGMVR